MFLASWLLHKVYASSSDKHRDVVWCCMVWSLFASSSSEVLQNGLYSLLGAVKFLETAAWRPAATSALAPRVNVAKIPCERRQSLHCGLSLPVFPFPVWQVC